MTYLAKLATALTAKRLLDHVTVTLPHPPPVAEQLTTILLGAHCCPRCVLRFLGVRDRNVHANLLALTREWSGLPFGGQHVNGETQAEEVGVEGEAESEDGVEAKRLKLEIEDGKTVGVPNPTSPANPVMQTALPMPSNDSAPQRTCSACLGLLQCDHHDLAGKAFKLFQSEGYSLGSNNKTFLLSMRLPPQLAIRQRSFVLLVEKEMGADMIDGSVSVEVKEILKYLISDAFAETSSITYDPESPFSLTVHYDHPQTKKEYEFMTKIPEADFKIKTSRQKGQILVHGTSFEKIAKSVDKLSYTHFADAAMCPPPIVTKPPRLVELGLQHAPIYVAGRYLKLQRHISNSPWEIGGKRMTEHSVEELIANKVDAFFRNDGHKFYSSGREDADVLMLGRGRPYYLELVNPRRVEASETELKALQDTINKEANGMVLSRDMQIVPREETKILKDAANTKSKSYSTLVKLASPVTAEALDKVSKIRDLAIKQQNPTRVPRRADLMRDKVIESLRVYPAAPTTVSPTDEVRVDLRTSAGTYVKEFVHGDNGRTNPNLASLLGVEWAKVLELDVLEVHLDWPKQIDSEIAPLI
ncbi:TIGR01213 family protein [Spizellomyces punctatus DAOM BR117]|uniref:tRNA pseudouridine(55) synthase n=1 Tax=Spizellomyces punctatus (strain DAOM BR117) TaxID=645134 RepID=A0A0L0HL98_SPIPD|nr:TIGR01213 family protein [Spizellomyces punctatus DAOM BR117]KND01902.1 TIGR01213 family protein [Spizellomyces punctatus DAOM BR117]|eukprot:XP_016609941.1 TIGR01213 family protein [Spizellomyces punctatus DAOM BR117]